MKIITLHSKKHGNHYCQVDDEDFETLNQFKWYADFVPSDGKFRARSRLGGNVKSPVLMHRFILEVKPNMLVDHVDMNPLNNQKTNLRVTNKANNMKNRNKQNNNTSGFKGVSWNKKDKKWRATIQCDGKWKFLGNFDTEYEAANAYDDAAEELHKQYARTNS